MIYPIVMYRDPVLRQRAKDIEPGTDISTLVEDMFETLEGANGIGLAAPQIGKSVRLFIVDGTSLDEEPGMETFRKVFINAEMIEELGTPWEFEEGCLSIPNIREKISRKEQLRIRYYDENWNQHEDTFNGMQDERRADLIGISLYLPVFFLHASLNHRALGHTAGKTFVHFIHRNGGEGLLQQDNKLADFRGDCGVFVL